MKLYGIDIAYQTDPLYAKEIMTSPPWQKKFNRDGSLKNELDPDYIEEYGCLLCAKLNAYNLFNKNKKFLTIKQLNDLIIKHKGYNYLFFLEKNQGDLEKTKKDCFGKESYQIPTIVNWILGIQSETNKYIGIIDIKSKNDFYIIKTPFGNTGHYSLIIDKDKTYIDSYDAKIKIPTTILDIIKITFKED